MNLESCAFTIMFGNWTKTQLQGRLVSFHTSNLQAEGLRV